MGTGQAHVSPLVGVGPAVFDVLSEDWKDGLEAGLAAEHLAHVQHSVVERLQPEVLELVLLRCEEEEDEKMIVRDCCGEDKGGSRIVVFVLLFFSLFLVWSGMSWLNKAAALKLATRMPTTPNTQRH